MLGVLGSALPITLILIILFGLTLYCTLHTMVWDKDTPIEDKMETLNRRMKTSSIPLLLFWVIFVTWLIHR